MLGIWQINRLNWKNNLIHEVSTSISMEPKALNPTNIGIDSQYLPVTFEGKFYENEIQEKTTHKKIKLARHNTSSINIMDKIEKLINAYQEYNEEEILSIMEQTIKESKLSNDNVVQMNKTTT